jgi:FtsZ-interacting cell division protein ZipA
MYRTSVRLAAALLLAVGLLFSNAPGAGAAAKKKPRTEAKASAKKPSKKDSKKESKKRDDRTAKRKKADTRSRTVAKKSSKKDDEDARATRRRREQPRPAVASKASDVDEEEEAEEPAGPRPANRLVAEIAPTRVVQIQNALIQKGLLVGPPTGVYDQATFTAMATFQSRNGWNANGNPTADSLKALGVPKNSGRPLYTATRAVDATAPPR